MRPFILSLLALFIGSCGQQPVANLPNLIPLPQQIQQTPGSYTLPDNFSIAYADESLAGAVTFLQRTLQSEGCSAVTGTSGDVTLGLDTSLDTIGGYRLDVSRRGINIQTGSYGGAIAAIATLRQLAQADTPRSFPIVAISDAPRFAWRGFMLDVARHFFTKEEVLSLLDKMAQYKFNKFHWHLTDDQGWRIEIKTHPELTDRGAWRTPNKHDQTCLERASAQENPTYLLPEKNMQIVDGKQQYGGYYTQDEIREVVAYAASLGIDVIPELDMPGHSLKIIENHPQLSCKGLAVWGETFSVPLCLGNDATLAFCKSIYTEVFELFPYKYIHLGADEVEKSHWKQCAKCQARIQALNLADENALQAWFVHDMERFFNDHDRTMIGWDEITSGGLSQTAVVEWWRSWVPAARTEALKNGNQLILAPVEFMYLDQDQDRNTLLKVYNYEPISEEMAGYEAQILGLHNNLWAELVPSFDRACYHIFPRFFAVSELAWCRPEQKDAAHFVARANTHLQQLDAAGWNYRIPDLDGFCNENSFIDTARVAIIKPYETIDVRYTTDGTIPGVTSTRYTAPIVITNDCTLTLRSFAQNGKAGDIATATYRKCDYQKSTTPSTSPTPGLVATWYDYQGESCAEIETAPLKGKYTTPVVQIPNEVSGNIGLVFTGYIHIPSDGIYSFYTYTDDGSVLTIDGLRVVDSDGPHSRRERSGQIALRNGLHPIEIRYFDSNGGILDVGLIDDQGIRRPLKAEMLSH